jgi:hypothetical protein
MAVQFTYVPIATQTLGSAASGVTFSSIPSTYQDLVLVCSYNGTSTAVNLYPNGDSGSNKSWTSLRGDGSSAQSGRGSAIAIQDYWTTVTNASGEFTVSTFNIMNYANTSTYKTFLVRRAVSSAYSEALVNLWRSTSAISSLNINSASGNFSAGSTFNLYGLAAA